MSLLVMGLPGGMEWVILLIVALLLFGGSRVAGMGKGASAPPTHLQAFFPRSMELLNGTARARDQELADSVKQPGSCGFP